MAMQKPFRKSACKAHPPLIPSRSEGEFGLGLGVVVRTIQAFFASRVALFSAAAASLLLRRNMGCTGSKDEGGATKMNA